SARSRLDGASVRCAAARRRAQVGRCAQRERTRPMGMYPGFGDLLRGYRAAAGLSQAELAEKAGLSTRGIADLERGARTAPFPQTVRRLVEALQLTDHERAMLVAAGARPARPTKVRADFERVDLPDQRAIPLPLTPLVGREVECAEICARLVDRPLITLVG